MRLRPMLLVLALIAARHASAGDAPGGAPKSPVGKPSPELDDSHDPAWLERMPDARAEAATRGLPLLAVARVATAARDQRLSPEAAELQALFATDADVREALRAFVLVRPGAHELTRVLRARGAAVPSAVVPSIVVCLHDEFVLASRCPWQFESKSQAKRELLATLGLALDMSRRVADGTAGDPALRDRARMSTLVDALSTGGVDTKEAAASSLGYVPGVESDALPLLGLAAKAESPRTRLEVVQALLRVDPRLLSPISQTAVRDGIVGADDQLFGVTVSKAAALGDPLPPGVLPALVRGVRSRTRVDGALDAIGQLAARATDCVGDLVAVLRATKDPNLQGKLVRTLGEMGPSAGAAAPALLDLAETSDVGSMVRGTKPWAALLKIGPGAKAIVPRLTTMLAKRGPDLRNAIELLGAIGPAARSATGALRAIAISDPAHAGAATRALRAIESADPAGSK